jgi:hypothetical protein
MRSPTISHPAPGPSGRWSRRSRGVEGTSGRVLDLSRLLLGLTVVVLGTIFLLDSAGVLSADRAIDRYWPLLIVAAGLLTLAERPPSVVRGTLLTGVGTVLLLFSTDVLEGDAWQYVWPVAIILVGLLVLARWNGRTVPSGTSREDVIRSTAIFGGPKLVSTTQALQGAWLTAIFGGITLDLRGARPDPHGASINATAAFGGIDILVPKGWRLSVRSTPVFGGLEDKTDHSEPPADDAPMLHVDAVTLFGGVEIKHQK